MRLSRERDEALHEIHRLRSELGGPRIPLSTRPPSGETRPRASVSPSSPSRSSSPIASSVGDSDDAQPISSVLSPPRGDPPPSSIAPRSSPPCAVAPRPSPSSQPPEELRRALTGAIVFAILARQSITAQTEARREHATLGRLLARHWQHQTRAFGRCGQVVGKSVERQRQALKAAIFRISQASCPWPSPECY